MTEIPERVLFHVWDRVHVRGPDECWPCDFSMGSHGYPQIGWYDPQLGKIAATLAHRAVWTSVHGPIPPRPRSKEQMTVDHLCRNRPCCNPAHLRLLPNAINAADNGFNRKTHCPHGHEYSVENTYRTPKGDRRCRACIRARY